MNDQPIQAIQGRDYVVRLDLWWQMRPAVQLVGQLDQLQIRPLTPEHAPVIGTGHADATPIEGMGLFINVVIDDEWNGLVAGLHLFSHVVHGAPEATEFLGVQVALGT